MSSRPFRLMVVASDRKMLRRISRFLSGFGFRVETLTDAGLARSVCCADPPDFILVDGDDIGLQHCRPLFADDQHRYTYSVLMSREINSAFLAEALEAGVADFLAKPLVYGELLARLRAGARVVEYERRVREQSAVEPTTSLSSRMAFRERLQREMDANGDWDVSCVLIAIDFFETLQQFHGIRAGQAIAQAVSERLKSLVGEWKYLACFESGVFAALLPDASDAAVQAWTESVREAIAGLEIPWNGESLKLTASFGVASNVREPVTADALIRYAEEGVGVAQFSGCHCVARSGQFDHETREWEDLARQGRLFDTTVARDVMVACHLLLQEEQEVQTATRLQSLYQLSEIPVVDGHGKLVGLFNSERLAFDSERPADRHLKVRDVMSTDVTTVVEDESFGGLMQFFMSDADANHVAVVVRRGRPLGMVYRSELAALIQPLSNTSFAPSQPCSMSSHYLRVSDSRCFDR